MTDQLVGFPGRGSLPGTNGPGVRFRDTAARYAMLPLRLFLGLTFLYAGIDKFADAGPFSAAMNTEVMERMLESSQGDAAAGPLVDLALEHPDLFGTGVALAEMAVGAGVLLGVLTRLAALGGALLTLSFWLTVSWSTDPYYFGQDLPYLLGFTTLVLAGSGPFALDRLIPTPQWMVRRNRRLFG